MSSDSAMNATCSKDDAFEEQASVPLLQQFPSVRSSDGAWSPRVPNLVMCLRVPFRSDWSYSYVGVSMVESGVWIDGLYCLRWKSFNMDWVLYSRFLWSLGFPQTLRFCWCHALLRDVVLQNIDPPRWKLPERRTHTRCSIHLDGE